MGVDVAARVGADACIIVETYVGVTVGVKVASVGVTLVVECLLYGSVIGSNSSENDHISLSGQFSLKPFGHLTNTFVGFLYFPSPNIIRSSLQPYLSEVCW